MIEKETFGRLSDGTEVSRYRITNKHKEYIEVLDYGAALHSAYILDADGNLGDVLLGVGKAEELEEFSMEGITIGRVGNRIAYGKCSIEGREYQLEVNNHGHFLHGAGGNYGHKMFHAIPDEKANSVQFILYDDGAGGFGCDAFAVVKIGFDDDHRISLDYIMTAGDTTLLCPTNHAYFNLDGRGDIREQMLLIEADKIAVKGRSGVPEGETLPVGDTAMDHRKWRKIGEAMKSDKGRLLPESPVYYDDFFLLNEHDEQEAVAKLYSPKSGRMMKVYTDMPCLVYYTPYPGMKSFARAKDGVPYEGYCGVCLETQFVPNAVNCSTFEIPVFHKGEVLHTATFYEFGIASGQDMTEHLCEG